jgi:UDP-glucose 4-epimerase
VTGCLVPHHVVPRRQGDPPALVADPSLAQKLLGWHAERSLEVIVETAWKWHKSRGSALI